MKNIRLFRGDTSSGLMNGMIEAFMGDEFQVVDGSADYFLVAMELDEMGNDLALVKSLRDNLSFFEGKTGAVLVKSDSELYTKEAAKNIIHVLNRNGAAFIGHSVVDAIASLKNMRKWAMQLGTSPQNALFDRCRDLGKRLYEYEPFNISRLLVLHANSRPNRSNTQDFFELVSKGLHVEYDVMEIEEGEIRDCRGCSFGACVYYSKNDTCFYGGIMVDEILPAIEKADGVMFLTPNYNDAVSAKMMALINRLTVLYRKGPFYDKKMFAVIVSGNSGSDSVACQLIGALNINKGFYLPPKFYVSAIANDPGEILLDNMVGDKAIEYAKRVK